MWGDLFGVLTVLIILYKYLVCFLSYFSFFHHTGKRMGESGQKLIQISNCSVIF